MYELQRHENYKNTIICKQFNTVYSLSIQCLNTIICKQCNTVYSLSIQCLNTIICKQFCLGHVSQHI